MGLQRFLLLYFRTITFLRKKNRAYINITMSQKYTIKTLANKGMLIALFGIDIFLVRKSKNIL